MAAAEIIRAPSPPPPITPQGGLLNTPPARFTAVEEKVKSETDCDVSPRAPWFGKNKRKLPERRANGESSASEYLSYQPGFSPHLRKARTAIPTTSKHGKAATPERHDDGETGGWKAARQLLQGIVTPARQRKHAASRPADVVASSYVSLLQTANEVAFSLDYALELEGRLRDADAELRKVRAELAEAKAAVVQESLGSRSSRRR